jgi:apolipoprotein D and lipocalin family protein
LKTYNALVAGESLDYLWILSRTPQLPDALKKDYLTIAELIGYNTDNLLWIKQDKMK